MLFYEEVMNIISPKAFAMATLSRIAIRGIIMMADPSCPSIPPKETTWS